MKNIQIPYWLYIELMRYHIGGCRDNDELIVKGLEDKAKSIVSRDLYTKMKAARTDEEREAARQRYISR